MSTEVSATEALSADTQFPKNSKENRYYYKHREEILEKKRIQRLQKNNADITQLPAQLPLEERRKKKMEMLGILSSETPARISSGVKVSTPKVEAQQ